MGQGDPTRSPTPTYHHTVQTEDAYICDSCGEEIVIPVDLSAGAAQEYVEDCPVCCRPNVIRVSVDSDGTPHIASHPEQDRI